MGHDDGPQAIKYFNAEVQKVLTSRNYLFLTPQENAPSPNVIMVTPNTQCEGEDERTSALSLSDVLLKDGQLRDMYLDDRPKRDKQSNADPQLQGNSNGDNLKRK